MEFVRVKFFILSRLAFFYITPYFCDYVNTYLNRSGSWLCIGYVEIYKRSQAEMPILTFRKVSDV